MIKHFVVYDSDGTILRTGATLAENFEEQAQEGEFILEGEASDTLHRIENGQIVNKDPEPGPTNEEIHTETMEYLRSERDSLLLYSDFSQLPDSPLSEYKKAEYAAYRQTLRELPDNHTTILDKDEIVWPSVPS